MIDRNCLDNCIACTSCTIQCPVMAASPKFRGPKLVGPALERFRLFEDDIEESLEYCSNCKNCDITCPSNVPVSTLNLLAKAKIYEKKGHKLRDWILSHGELFAKLAGPLAPLANFGMANPITRAVLGKIGIAGRPLPPYAFRSFIRRFRAVKQQFSPNKVVFYPGCYINYNAPQVGMDFVKVMQMSGYEVIVPEVVCCGTPIASNGFLAQAEKNARRNIRELAAWAGQGFPVVTCCPSCGLMLKQEYLELFDIPGAEEVAAMHRDAGEFILELLDSGRISLDNAKAAAGNYLYHAPCHLRAQGVGYPFFRLLKSLPGVKILDADAGCCGIAGSYGFKKDKYDIAMKIGRPLFDKIEGCRPDMVVTECGTCREQIMHGAGAKTLHPVSLLARCDITVISQF